MSLHFRGEAKDGDINLGSIRIETIFKTMRLDETTGEVNEDRKEKRSKNRATRYSSITRSWPGG